MKRSLRAIFVLFSACASLAGNAASAPQGSPPQFAISFGGTGASYLLDYQNHTFTQTELPGQQHAPKTGSITIVAGTDMSPRFYQWLGKALAANEEGGPIAIDTLAALNKISTELKVEHPKIDTITVPELNSDSKEMGSLRINMVPNGAAMVTPPSTPISFDPSGAIQWGKASFKLSISGVNCTHVTKIGSLTINPANPDAKNMTLTISGDQMLDFLHWDSTKSGTLQVTGGGGTLFEVDFRGLKFVKYSGLASATVTLSCSQVFIRFGI